MESDNLRKRQVDLLIKLARAQENIKAGESPDFVTATTFGGATIVLPDGENIDLNRHDLDELIDCNYVRVTRYHDHNDICGHVTNLGLNFVEKLDNSRNKHPDAVSKDTNDISLVELSGRWTIDNGRATYHGPSPKSEHPLGLVCSDLRLATGVVSAECSVSGDGCGRILLGYRNPQSRYISAGLVGYGFAYVISEYVPNFGWKAMALAGELSALAKGRTYRLEVHVKQESIRLCVNGVQVIDAELDQPLSGEQVGYYAWGSGTVSFSSITVIPDSIVQDTNEDMAQIDSVSLKEPVGSPYGFTAYDWKVISEKRKRKKTINVVLGYKFKSPHYNTDKLIENVGKMFRSTQEECNRIDEKHRANLEFHPLAAAYGEHLFNDIARSIISSDIAVFETSDHNPNVFLEMGVALTWGVPVLPIKHVDSQKPPTDVSGQTWADYTKDASSFVDPDHSAKLRHLLERAIRKKLKDEK